MKIVAPSYEIILPNGGEFDRNEAFLMLQHIEKCARTCYKSEGCITPTSAPKFVSKISNVYKHESVIEHCSLSVRFICDRGVSHELVRHRIAAYSQESTRYCNYSNDKHGNEITVIRPLFFDPESPEYAFWRASCEASEKSYFKLLELGRTPQEARSVLPNSLKTEIIMTCNLREWKHVLKLRTADNAHPQMRQIMIPLKNHLDFVMPEIFEQ